MGSTGTVKIAVGSLRVVLAFVSVLGAVVVGLTAMALTLAGNGALPGFFRFCFGVLASLGGLALVASVIILARNPRLLSRAIVVTQDAVVMPARRFGAIPMSQVSGVGLVRLANPRNGLPAGGWAVGVWRIDEPIAYAGGLQTTAGVADPAGGRVWDAALRLRNAVIERQGPHGLLTREESQRYARFGPFDAFTGVCDPSQVTAET